MFWFVLAHFVAFIVDLAIGTRRGDREKDLQLLVLRQQVRLLQRQRPRLPRLARGEKLTLAVLTAALARLTAGPRGQLDRYLLLFKPDTVLTWHRALVRRTWTYRRARRGGRPTIPVEVDALILRPRGRTRAGGIGASRGSWASSATPSAPPPCGRPSGGTACRPPRSDGRRRHGATSSGRTRTSCWPAISSPSRRSA